MFTKPAFVENLQKSEGRHSEIRAILLGSKALLTDRKQESRVPWGHVITRFEDTGVKEASIKEWDRRQESATYEDLYDIRSIMLPVFTMHNHVWRKLLQTKFRFPTWLAPTAVAILIFNIITFPNTASAVSVKPSSKNVKLASSSAMMNLKKAPLQASPIRFRSMTFPKLLPVVALRSADITISTRAIRSYAFRASIGVSTWVSSWTAQKIAFAESRNNCKSVGSHGVYRGKWQMDPHFWATYGGLKFASRPDLATCTQQDQVAYRGWVSRHYQPWQTYSLFAHAKG